MIDRRPILIELKPEYVEQSAFLWGHLSFLIFALTGCTDPDAAINALMPFRGKDDLLSFNFSEDSR